MLIAAVWLVAAAAAVPGRWLDLPVAADVTDLEDAHAQR